MKRAFWVKKVYERIEKRRGWWKYIAIIGTKGSYNKSLFENKGMESQSRVVWIYTLNEGG